mgnify:CR=1 FL=1
MHIKFSKEDKNQILQFFNNNLDNDQKGRFIIFYNNVIDTEAKKLGIDVTKPLVNIDKVLKNQDKLFAKLYIPIVKQAITIYNEATNNYLHNQAEKDIVTIDNKVLDKFDKLMKHFELNLKKQESNSKIVEEYKKNGAKRKDIIYGNMRPE